jgi:excisionase family DNA binding protein
MKPDDNENEIQIRDFEHLLTLKEAAHLLGMHWKTLEVLARNGNVPAAKLGKRWRFRATSLDQWLSTRLQSARVESAIPLSGKLVSQPRRAS